MRRFPMRPMMKCGTATPIAAPSITLGRSANLTKIRINAIATTVVPPVIIA